jgi:hypothetical protein
MSPLSAESFPFLRVSQVFYGNAVDCHATIELNQHMKGCQTLKEKEMLESAK